MKLLLTSAGVQNPSIREALDRLLDKPVEEADALCIPTGQWGHPGCGPVGARRFVTGESLPMCDLGWRSVGLLELTALPSMRSDRWVSWVTGADVLLVDGGAADYLAHWMRESGFVDLLPKLDDTVWVGLSAGSMVMTPRIGDDFLAWQESGGDDRGLGVVDFSIFPHLGMEPSNLMADAEGWAAGLGNRSYAIDDRTAILVADGAVEVVSEGEWRYFPG